MYSLRELRREDIVVINSWRAKRELIDYLGAPYRFINEEVDNKWYDAYLVNRGSTIRASIVDKDGKVVGLVSLTNINRINQTAIFHIMIGDRDHQGKGCGQFAIEQMLYHAFGDMNLNRIELTVLESNSRAINFYEKNNFKKEGIKRKAVYKNGSFQNMYLMSLLKEDYLDKANNK